MQCLKRWLELKSWQLELMSAAQNDSNNRRDRQIAAGLHHADAPKVADFHVVSSCTLHEGSMVLVVQLQGSCKALELGWCWPWNSGSFLHAMSQDLTRLQK